MINGLEKKLREQLLREVKSFAVQSPWLLLLMFGGLVLFFSLLMQLLGQPGFEVAVKLVREAALPMLAIQAHMLAAAVVAGAVCYLLGREQIKVLSHYLGTLIGSNVPGLNFLRLAIWGRGLALLYQPHVPILRSIRLPQPVNTAFKHVSGLSPQLE